MFFAMLLVLAVSSQAAQTAPEHSPVAMSERSRWTSTEIPNLQMKAPTGDPASDAMVATRLRATRRVRTPLHAHPVDEQLTVIKGTVSLETVGQSKTTRRLQSGQTMVLKSGVCHAMTFGAGSEVELRGKGKLMTNWADPSAVKALSEKQVDSASERTKMKREQEKK
jgi:quercetin dioxygenase-like cupin family protein